MLGIAITSLQSMGLPQIQRFTRLPYANSSDCPATKGIGDSSFFVHFLKLELQKLRFRRFGDESAMQMVLAGYVLYGGGDFAVEVATYLLDLSATAELARRPGEAPIFPLVSDIVSSGVVRREGLETILRASPEIHSNIATVRDVNQKQVIICVGDAHVRHRILAELRLEDVRLGTVVHPSAYVSGTAKIGDGTIICPSVFVGPFASVGSNCALNVGAIVGHDVILGDSTVLSPGADVNGHAEAGEAAFIGAGAILNPKARLGAFGKLSAGSVLNARVGDGFLMHGNPAKGRQMFRVQ